MFELSRVELSREIWFVIGFSILIPCLTESYNQPVQDEEWSNDEAYGTEAADASMPDDSNNVWGEPDDSNNAWGEEPWRVTWFGIL